MHQMAFLYVWLTREGVALAGMVHGSLKYGCVNQVF